MNANEQLTTNVILKRLQQRVSMVNAKLLLDSAKTQTGISTDADVALEMDQAKALCLNMINQGGPSFQVGQSIYKEYLM